MTKQITASEMGKLGGTNRAKKYNKKQLSEWAKMGGRPKKVINSLPIAKT